ncbi:MAG: hypothetical protein F4X92_02830 [Gammaproteobacteria bacterium]|nr:hypothetical protein [Gammaproteobacteria bacterium]
MVPEFCVFLTNEQNDLTGAYYRMLTGNDAVERISVTGYGVSEEAIQFTDRPASDRLIHSLDLAEAFARIEINNFRHGRFFACDNLIFQEVATVQHMSTMIIRGQFNARTPMRILWELHQVLPGANFYVIPDSGHAFDESGITVV